MTDFEWRIRRGSRITRFSDGLVLQGGRPGELGLRVCLAAGGQTLSDALGLLTPLAAACTSEGIRRDTGIVSWLHWPNLVTFDGRVVARTSLSSVAPQRPDRDAQVVFGISVNCFADLRPDPRSGLRETSILDVLGVEIDLDLLRGKILHALEWYYAEWERGMHRKLVDRMRPTIAWLGSDVEVMAADGEVMKGRAMGLDERGSLLLDPRGGKGTTRTLTLRPDSVWLVREAK